ncbi:hypothetical protein GCM10022292_08240 [Winogradskyella damuponensis]|uniref:Uncharacterized protein n=2 Tax=Flavobacteriaceae TaxID=49546 RepID=A0ABP8CNI5_9FLAO
MSICSAQKVKFKKKKVILDDKEILSYKQIPFYSQRYFYKLDTSEELIYISLERNGTNNYDGDDYIKIYFSEKDILIETKSLFYGTNTKPVIKKLVLEGVIETDGNINYEKVAKFKKRYNDIINK